MRKPPRTIASRIVAHVREYLQLWSPLYLRTRTGLLVRITRRTEMRIYERMFVEDMFPLTAITTASDQAKPGVFDVGACFGYFSLSVLDRFPDAQVHLFEANPKLIPIIRHHRDINDCHGWTINHAAVGSSAEAVTIFLSSTPLVASLNPCKAAQHCARGACAVPGIRLDDYLAASSIDRIDIMKLDVEGSEEEIIRASPSTFARVEALFIRVFPPFSELKRVEDLLLPQGLRLSEAAQHHHDEYLFIRQKPASQTTTLHSMMHLLLGCPAFSGLL